MKLPSSSSQTGYECVKAYNTKAGRESFCTFLSLSFTFWFSPGGLLLLKHKEKSTERETLMHTAPWAFFV